jgi:hypothetical protein
MEPSLPERYSRRREESPFAQGVPVPGTPSLDGSPGPDHPNRRPKQVAAAEDGRTPPDKTEDYRLFPLLRARTGVRLNWGSKDETYSDSSREGGAGPAERVQGTSGLREIEKCAGAREANGGRGEPMDGGAGVLQCSY